MRRLTHILSTDVLWTRPTDLYVANFHEAQNHLRDIEKDARHMHDFFMGRIRAMETPGASRDVWISQASYLEL